jgi:hypothetical protein
MQDWKLYIDKQHISNVENKKFPWVHENGRIPFGHK